MQKPSVSLPRLGRTRRAFLTRSAQLAAAGWLAPQIVPASAVGLGATAPSGRINVALIGSGGRGLAEGQIYCHYDTCQMVAVCDPREDRRLHAQRFVERIYATRASGGAYRGCRAFADFRDVLARPDVDAVYIATGDHWHVPLTIAAARAGKDMHTEKPLGVSVRQDLAALAAVRRYGRVFQYGTERRSTPAARHAIELVLNGRIGKVKEAYVISPGSIIGGQAAPVLPVPQGFDYDLWLGPAPEAPFCHDRCLVNTGIFHIYDYALGFIAGWAAHPLDLFQWWADHAGLTTPVSIEGTGVLPEEGLYNTALQWDLRLRYENGFTLRFLDNVTLRKYPDVPGLRDHNAATFIGDQGWLSVSYSDLLTHPAGVKDSIIGPNEIHLQRSASHQIDWTDCVRTRRDPVSHVESAVRSDLVSQLSDICIRVGRPIRWDPVKETLVDDPTAQKMLSRPLRAPWNEFMQ